MVRSAPRKPSRPEVESAVGTTRRNVIAYESLFDVLSDVVDYIRGVGAQSPVYALSMSGNAVQTVFSGAGVPTKAAGATVFDPSSIDFEHTANRVTYVGEFTRRFRFLAVSNTSGTAGNSVGLYIAKNGVPILSSQAINTINASGVGENAVGFAMATLESGDYVEYWIENKTAANPVIVTDLSMTGQAVL